jgi:hypothetical protein
MSGKHLVCQGAICECQFGNVPDKLKVLTQQKHFINDKDASKKLVATHVDIGMTFEKNTFGQCKLQPIPGGYKPCQPALQQWTGQYEKVKYEINGGNPLLEDSKGICAISGSPCIKITNHGQTAEPTQQNIDNADDEILAEFMPFVNLKDKPKKYIPINQ